MSDKLQAQRIERMRIAQTFGSAYGKSLRSRLTSVLSIVDARLDVECKLVFPCEGYILATYHDEIKELVELLTPTN